jgi:hypothetical protein
MDKKYLDGENNPLKEGWYLGVFSGSSNSTASKAARRLSFIRQKDQEFLEYSGRVPTRVTPDFAKNFFPMDLRVYIMTLRDATDDVLGVVEKMVSDKVLSPDVRYDLNTSLNAAFFTEGRDLYDRKLKYPQPNEEKCVDPA